MASHVRTDGQDSAGELPGQFPLETGSPEQSYAPRWQTRSLQASAPIRRLPRASTSARLARSSSSIRPLCKPSSCQARIVIPLSRMDSAKPSLDRVSVTPICPKRSQLTAPMRLGRKARTRETLHKSRLFGRRLHSCVKLAPHSAPRLFRGTRLINGSHPTGQSLRG